MNKLSWIRVIAMLLLVAMLVTSESMAIFASSVAISTSNISLPIESAHIVSQHKTKSIISKNIEYLFSNLDSYETFSAAEKAAIFSLVVPGFDSALVKQAEKEQQDLLMQFESLPEKTKTEVRVLQYQEAGKTFADLNEYEKEEIFNYLNIKKEKYAIVSSIFESLKAENISLWDSLHAIQISAGGLFTIDEAMNLLSTFETRAERDMQLNAFSRFVESFEKPVLAIAGNLTNDIDLYNINHIDSSLREQKINYINAAAFTTAKEMFLDGISVSNIKAAFCVGAALEIAPELLVIRDNSVVKSGASSCFVDKFAVNTSAVDNKLAANALEASASVGTQMDTLLIPSENAASNTFITNKEELLSAAYAIQSALYGTSVGNGSGNSVTNPPFLADLSNETGVSLNSGDSYYSTEILNIPGMDGLNMTLGIEYNSGRSNVSDITPGASTYSETFVINVEYYEYLKLGTQEIFYDSYWDVIVCVDEEELEDTCQNLDDEMFTGDRETYDEPVSISKVVEEAVSETRKVTGTYEPFAVTDVVVVGESVPQTIQYSDDIGYTGTLYPYYSNLCVESERVSTGDNTWEMTVTVDYLYSGVASVSSTSGEIYVNDYYVDDDYTRWATAEGKAYAEYRCNIGSGWMWQLPSIQPFDDGSFAYLYLPERGRLVVEEWWNGCWLYNYYLDDIHVSCDTTYQSPQGIASYYKLVESDGHVTYFSQDGRLLAEFDAYGNSLTYQYLSTDAAGLLSSISDQFGRSVVITYQTLSDSSRTVTVTAPDGSTTVLSLTGVTSDRRTAWQLTSITYPDNSVESYQYTVSNSRFNFNSKYNLGSSLLEKSFFLLSRITHPTGAAIYYEYDCVPVNYALLGSRQHFRVTERTAYGNSITFEYDGEYTDYPNTVIELDKDYYYSVKAVDSNDTYIEYVFDSQQLLCRKHKSAGPRTTELWIYNNDGLVTAYGYMEGSTSNTYAGVSYTEMYDYDSAGRVIHYYSPLANGDRGRYDVMTGYFYDTDSWVPSRIQYQTDTNNRYVTVNTLTSDGNSVAKTETYLNSPANVVARTEYTYDTNGRVLTQKEYVSDTDYVETGYVYAGQNLASVTLYGIPDENGILGSITESYTYDGMGNVLTYTDGDGGVTSNTYDNMGRVTASTSPEGRTITYVYNTAQNRVLYTAGTNIPVTYQYNNVGQLKSESATGYGTLKSLTYNTHHLVKTTSNYNGVSSYGKTTYTYDNADRVTETVLTGAGGQVYRTEQYSYTTYTQKKDSYTLVGELGAPSQASYKIYDKYNRVVTEQYGTTEGSIYTVEYTYDNIGRVDTKLASAPGSSDNLTRYVYDYYGNVLEEIDSLGTVYTATYDWLGRKTSHTLPGMSVTSYIYDGLDRVISETVADIDGTEVSRINYRYDSLGNLIYKEQNVAAIDSTSPLWSTVAYTYDKDGNLTDTVTATGTDAAFYTHYVYDGNNRMIAQYAGMSQPYSDTMTAADYQLTLYGYDNRGNLVSLTDALGKTESYTYDRNGYMTSRTERDGKVTCYTYDAAGNVLTDVVYSDSTKTTVLSERTSTYYLTGALESVTEDGVTTSYTYDDRGNLLTETTGTVVISYTYDNCGNMLSYSVTDNGNAVTSVGYGYDLRNRLVTVSGINGLTSYGYNPANYRISEETQTPDGGIRVDYTYGYGGKLVRTRSYGLLNPATVYEDISYTYYADGNIQTEHDSVDNITTAYTYDLAGRLLTEITPTDSYTYTYLPSGNRASLVHNGTTTTYTYDANNRLLTETEGDEVKTYTYDDNGNTLSNGEQTFTYDARNRQITATVGDYTVSYTYNANGLRSSKTAAFVLSNYIWVGQNMVCEYSYTPTDGDTYVYGHTLLSDGDSLYVYNGHGDVTALVSFEGVILQTYDYDAFGVETEPDENDTNPFRYAGQYYDTETGTYYLRARYYAPATGRFTQQDNWGYANPNDPLSLNLYVYCQNDPVISADTSGHFLISTAVLIGAIIGGVIGATAGGIISYNTAKKYGAEGWELAGWTALGILGGGIVGAGIGAVLGYGIGYIAGGTYANGLVVKSVNDAVSRFMLNGNNINHVLGKAAHNLSGYSAESLSKLMVDTLMNGVVDVYKSVQCVYWAEMDATVTFIIIDGVLHISDMWIG